MKYAIMALSLLASISFASANTTQDPGFKSFAPENDLYVPVGVRAEVTEEQFSNMIKKLEDIYKPIVKAEGGHLVFFNKWDDGTVNAYTKRQNGDWEVHMFGGLARFTGMTHLGIAAVACHELGHQLGGLPLKTSWWGGTSWAAAEGQSDYYSTAKCMKMYLEGENNIEIAANMEIYPEVAEACESAYSYEEDIAICKRSAMAGEVLGKVLAGMGNSAEPSITTPSTLEVTKTNIAGYPSAQCRVDTYFQGALCDIPYSVAPNTTDIHEGYCARVNGYEIGTRPLCWFKPE